MADCLSELTGSKLYCSNGNFMHMLRNKRNNYVQIFFKRENFTINKSVTVYANM
jgi:hypothetical protein